MPSVRYRKNWTTRDKMRKRGRLMESYAERKSERES